jgi:hypothetical protein
MIEDSEKAKWWHRLAKIIYAFCYITIPFLLMSAWNSDALKGCDDGNNYYFYTNYFYETAHCSIFKKTLTESVLTTLIVLTLTIIFIRLVKIGFIYVAFGEKPQWRKEFKQWF